jgi:hypothetical protein
MIKYMCKNNFRRCKMKTVIFKKDGKSLDMFEVMDVVRAIETFTAVNETKDGKPDYYVMYFSVEIDNKHLYLVIAEPYLFESNNKHTEIKIKELNMDVLIESTHEATIYSYSIENKPMNDKIMLYYLLSKLLDSNNYKLTQEPDTVFISE